jgi:hypothetical protein
MASKKRTPRARATGKRPKATRGASKAAAPRVVDLGDVDAPSSGNGASSGRNGASSELSDVDALAIANAVIAEDEQRASVGATPATPATAPPVIEHTAADERAAALAGGALVAGYDGAKAVASNLDANRNELAETAFLMLPDDWADDDDARRLVYTLEAPALVALLAILGAQWRDGYQTAVNDHARGEPFLVQAGPGDGAGDLLADDGPPSPDA